jgi:hypothetical protein
MRVVVPSVADARISAEPTLRPVTLAVAEPVLEVGLTDSTVATVGLLEAKLMVIPPTL